MSLNLEKYNIEMATHVLYCRHCIGHDRCKDYFMYCIPLKMTKKGKLKVIVFGERHWKYNLDVKKIRYVDPCKVVKK